MVKDVTSNASKTHCRCLFVEVSLRFSIGLGGFCKVFEDGDVLREVSLTLTLTPFFLDSACAVADVGGGGKYRGGDTCLGESPARSVGPIAMDVVVLSAE